MRGFLTPIMRDVSWECRHVSGSNGWVDAVLGVVILASFIIQVRIFFNGIGGGLGLAAFVTVAVLVTLKQFTRSALPINRSENMAIQKPSIRSQAGYSVANLQSEGSTRRGISRWPAAAIASIAVAAAVFGGSIWPTQFGSKKSISAATAPVSVADEVTPDPSAPEAEVRTGAIDAVTPSSTAGAAEVNPGATAPIQNKSSESPPDKGAESTAMLKLASTAIDDRRAGSEEPKTASPAAPEVIAVREPALGEIRKDDDRAGHEALFLRFLQWREARGSSVAPSARQNAAQSHRVRRPAAISTLQATNPRPRSTLPSSAAQATAVPSPGARARRPHLGDTQTHATTR